MLKKLVITGAVVTAVAGLGLSTPAYAQPWDGTDGPGDVTEILPIQICRQVHLLDEVHDLLASHSEDNSGPCINGPVQRDTTNRIVNVDPDHHGRLQRAMSCY